MELKDFLIQTQKDVRSQYSTGINEQNSTFPYPESVFSEIVMQHMFEIGMTFEPVVCHYSAKIRNAQLRLSGYAISDEADQLDLFVSLYDSVDTVTPIPDQQTKKAAEQCLRFLSKCVQSQLASSMDQSSDAYALAVTIQESYLNLDQIRIYVLTDRQAKAKSFKAREINNKIIKLEVMDIERLHRHWSAGKPRDELVVNFKEVTGSPLPCVYIPGDMDEYDYALTVIPGEALRFVYEKYDARLLEANVRSFLSMTGKINRGIRDTIKQNPQRFMAYNNGIVIITDEISLGRTSDGGPGIQWMKGMQIVNGGQTTASIYFTKRKNPEVDLTRVRIPAKVIILNSDNIIEEEKLISDISKYANSQNSVRQSDLSANKPFHVEMEKLAMSTYCPDGTGRWFYERSAGSYNTMLTREGTTQAKLKKLKQAIPFSRKITKTDLAKFLNTWDQIPDSVSFGAQKNFRLFMERVGDGSKNGSDTSLPDVSEFKKMIAKAILYKSSVKIIHSMYPPGHPKSQVCNYTVSVISNRLGSQIDLNKIWLKQDISLRFKEQVQIWAAEVNDILHKTADGRMVSEWAKKAECWTAVRNSKYSNPIDGIPEIF